MLYKTTKLSRTLMIAMLMMALCVSLAAKQKLGAEAKRYMRSGNIYWGQENWDEAAAQYEKVLALQPDYIEALKKMGDLNFYWGENKGQYLTLEDGSKKHAAPEVAVEHYMKAYEYFTGCLEALAIPENHEKGGKRDEQLEMEEDATNKLKSCRIRLYNIALNQMKDENYPLAESTAARVIELDPEYVQTYSLMSSILAKQGKDAEAADYLEQAAEMSGDVNLYINVAATYFNSENFAKAVEWYQKSAELAPDNVDVFFNMAVTYLQMDDKAGALAAFGKVAELDPTNIDALTWASNLASQLDQPQESLKYLELAIAQQPDNIDWLSAICSKYFTLKNWEKLIEYGDMWRQAAPEDPMPLQFMYQAATNLGRTDEANQYMSAYEKLQ